MSEFRRTLGKVPDTVTTILTINQSTIISVYKSHTPLQLFHLPVSAGNGVYLDSDAYDEIEVGNEVPENADFGVTISGDSMEPQFVNGQTVWVHAQNELDDGEIGIFYHNGEGFIKKLEHHNGKTFLFSLNHRKYQSREIKKDDVFLVYGKVVG